MRPPPLPDPRSVTVSSYGRLTGGAGGGSAMELDEYLPVLQRANARFAEAAAAAVLEHGWRARVPSCPGWDLADLVWHLAEVQHFWAWVVRTRAQDPSGYPEPDRKPDAQLLASLAAASAELEAALDGAAPAEPVWTWAPRRDVA